MDDINAVRSAGRNTEAWPPSVHPEGARSALPLESLLRHKTLIATSTICFLILGIVYAAARPATYMASSQLLVLSRQFQNGPDPVVTSAPADSSLVQNQIEIIQSRTVLLNAVHALGLQSIAVVAPEARGLSRLPSLMIELLDGLISRRSASTWATSEELKRERALESLRKRLSVKRVGSSHIIWVTFKAFDPNTAANTVNEIVQASLRNVLGATEGKIGGREYIRDLGPTIRVLSAATAPIHPVGPSGLLIAAAATVLGFGLGAGLAVLKDYTDRTIRTPEQARSLIGVDCLGLIPWMKADKNETTEHLLARLASSKDPNHPHSILCQTIRRVNAVTLEESKRGMRSLGVVATLPGEGATSVARDLALLAASAGRKVLLVDGVGTDPSLSRLLAPSARTGLVEVVSHRAPLTTSVLTDEGSGLHFLPLGEPSAFDLDRMWYSPMDDFLREASEAYDLLIMDLPPLACAADARLAAPMLDAFLLVIKWGEAEAAAVQQALRQSGQVGSKMLGFVLNKVDVRTISRRHRVAAQEFGIDDPDTRAREIHSSGPGEHERKVIEMPARSPSNRGEPQAALNVRE